MNKENLVKILESLNINCNEGIQNDDSHKNPRIVYWDYAWEPLTASGSKYNMIVTYQISFFNDCTPRESDKLINLIHKLEEQNINPIVNHEYVEKSQEWHSYFSIDILENV